MSAKNKGYNAGIAATDNKRVQRLEQASKTSTYGKGIFEVVTHKIAHPERLTEEKRSMDDRFRNPIVKVNYETGERINRLQEYWDRGRNK